MGHGGDSDTAEAPGRPWGSEGTTRAWWEAVCLWARGALGKSHPPASAHSTASAAGVTEGVQMGEMADAR